ELLQLFTKADAGIVERAISATAGLPPIVACADTQGLMARAPMPKDANTRQKGLELQTQINKVAAAPKGGPLSRRPRNARPGPFDGPHPRLSSHRGPCRASQCGGGGRSRSIQGGRRPFQ